MLEDVSSALARRGGIEKGGPTIGHGRRSELARGILAAGEHGRQWEMCQRMRCRNCLRVLIASTSFCLTGYQLLRSFFSAALGFPMNFNELLGSVELGAMSRTWLGLWYSNCSRLWKWPFLTLAMGGFHQVQVKSRACACFKFWCIHSQAYLLALPLPLLPGW